ncbi:MAG: hypothetical protein EAZ30_00665 [Betaproteobacteria bacterium]|nr:MAG: hypothetical protein EAZ30_00665 [Betaproteobacteria bacterium]
MEKIIPAIAATFVECPTMCMLANEAVTKVRRARIQARRWEKVSVINASEIKVLPKHIMRSTSLEVGNPRCSGARDGSTKNINAKGIAHTNKSDIARLKFIAINSLTRVALE